VQAVTLRAKAIDAITSDAAYSAASDNDMWNSASAQFNWGALITALFSDPDVLEGMREALVGAKLSEQLVDYGDGKRVYRYNTNETAADRVVAALVAAFTEEGEAR
jgi:hypothetical protein